VTIRENNTHQFTVGLIQGHTKRRPEAVVSQGQHSIAQYLHQNGDSRGTAAVGDNFLQTVRAACHGFDAKARKLGDSADPADPSYIESLCLGIKARREPIEILHRIRNGHSGAPMASLRSRGCKRHQTAGLRERLPAE
jgi:hypothetical protein